MVGTYAVYFLGTVQGIETVAGLCMNHGNVHFYCRQCCCHCGIGITIDHDEIRLALDDRNNGISHLLYATCTSQVPTRSRYIHLFEEYLTHIVIIVLPSMQYSLLDVYRRGSIVLTDIVTHYRCLHKLWPCAYDGYYFHFTFNIQLSTFNSQLSTRITIFRFVYPLTKLVPSTP